MTPGFALQLYLASLQLSTHASQRGVTAALRSHFELAGADGALLLAETAYCMRSMQQTAFEQFDHQARLLKLLRDQNEFECLSMDGSYKACMSLTGQTRHGRRKHPVEHSDSQHEEFHVAMSVLSKTGCLVALFLVRYEACWRVLQKLKSVLPDNCHLQVKVLKVDRPWEYDVPETYRILPKLEAIIGDGLHRVLKVEACYGENRSDISSELRAIHKKFSAPALPSDCTYFAKRTAQGRHFARMRPTVDFDNEVARLTAIKAERILSNLHPNRAFKNVDEYTTMVAALAVKYSDEVDARRCKDGSVRAILRNGTAYATFQYQQNNSRYMRLTLDPSGVFFGTTSNEAEHKTLKAHFANVYTQTLDRLEHGLRYFTLMRQFQWFCRRYMHYPSANMQPADMLRLMLSYMSRQAQ